MQICCLQLSFESVTLHLLYNLHLGRSDTFCIFIYHVLLVTSEFRGLF